MTTDDEIPPDIAHGIALAGALIKAMLQDPDGRAATVLHESIVNDMARPLPDGDSVAIEAELHRRGLIVAGIVRAMAGAVVGTVRAAETAGVVTHTERLDSTYDFLLDAEFAFCDQATIDRNRVEFEDE